MINFIIEGTSIVEFYTYRRARVHYSFSIDLSRDDLDDINSYIRRNGYNPDNHICWKDRNGVCCWKMDHKLYVGTSIIEKSY